ncbi:proteoglycan 4-like isoform X4 [Mya arenaria]|uniref:proteoglycan 4-like isoform X4 n=1 Tax=Mya arenaria TaxID=6604 RepID=UPI0022DFA272|nr:proteoglycan 4-like isoform X4 [Mya arenaria]
MTERTLLLFSGLLLLHYVAAQGPKTAWQAGGVGMGVAVRPTTSPPDPTDHQINIALMNINNAKTEVQAAKAAAAIFSPTLDMSDNVKQAVETKVRQLRTPPGWVHPIPPPLPFGFDVMNLIMGAYYGTATEPPAGAAIPAMPMMGANMGPPTTIVRGPAGPHAMPGMPGSGSGMGGWAEPTQWEVDLAIHNINAATTEAAAAAAAAAVYRVHLDPPDAVVGVFEEKVARLRSPNWTQRRPPPLPRNFNPLPLIIAAFNELQAIQKAEAAKKAAAAAASVPKPGTKPGRPPPRSRPPPNHPQPKRTRELSAHPSRQEVERQLMLERQQQREVYGSSGTSYVNKPAPKNDYFFQSRSSGLDINRNAPAYRTKTMRPAPQGRADPFLNTRVFTTPKPQNSNREPTQPVKKASPLPVKRAPPTNFNKPPSQNVNGAPSQTVKRAPTPDVNRAPTPRQTDAFVMNIKNEPATPPPNPKTPSQSPSSNGGTSRYSAQVMSPGAIQPQRINAPISRASDPPAKPTTKRPSIPTPKFSRSTIPKEVPTSDPFTKPSFTAPPKQPSHTSLKSRYPGLILKSQAEQTNLDMALSEGTTVQEGKQNVVSPVEVKRLSDIPVPTSAKEEKSKFKAFDPNSFQPSQQIWSMGEFGNGVNELLKTSIMESESIPIPAKHTPLPPSTTTTKRPATPTTQTPLPPPPPRKPKAVAKTTPTEASPPQPEAKKAVTQQTRMNQLEDLLKGISASDLQNLVDIIKTKASGSRAEPAATATSEPPKPAPRDPAPEPPRRRPSPGFIPPPPGSGNQGPPREARRGPSNQVPPGSGSWQQSPPAMDMSGPPPSRDNMPPWARNGQGSMRGPQSQDMGGPYMGMGGPPRGMGGSPRGMGGPPRGMGGQGGPPGGMDMNNPQVARLIRVARQKMLSAGTGGQSRNPITGEAPEAPEGGAAAGGMNPMMMMALMNQGGGGGSGAGAMGGMDLSALLGGSGGSNPMASLMGGGMPGMGGMGGLGALMGNMGGSSGEGGAMGGMGGMGAMAGLMGLMGGQGNSASAGETPSGGSGANPMAMLQALQAANGGSSGGGNPLAALQALQGGGSMTAPSEGGLNSQMIAALMGNGSGGGSSGGLGALGAMLGNRSGSGGGLPPGLAAAMMNPDGPDFLTSGPFGSFGGLSGMMGGFPGMTQA